MQLSVATVEDLSILITRSVHGSTDAHTRARAARARDTGVRTDYYNCSYIRSGIVILYTLLYVKVLNRQCINYYHY